MKKIIYAFTLVLGTFFFANTAMAQYGRDVYRDRDRDVYYHRDRDVRYDDDYYRHGNRHRDYRNYNRRVVVVPWARYHNYNYRYHAYFPDYNLFYDPYRGGYEYMYGNRWIFSQTLPAYYGNIDLGRARITIMSNVPVNRAPHYYYNDYSRRYPARRGYGYYR